VVGVGLEAARQAAELRSAPAILGIGVTAGTAPLARVGRFNENQLRTVEAALVRKLPPELAEGRVKKGPVEAPLPTPSLRHLLHSEVLHHDATVALGQHRGGFAKHVVPRVSNSSMGTGKACSCLASVARAALLAAQALLQPPDLALIPLKGARVLDPGAVRQRGEAHDAEIETNGRESVRGQLSRLDLRRDGHVPPTCTFMDRGLRVMACRNVAPLTGLEAHSSDPRELHGALIDPDRAGEPEPSDTAAAGLESGIAGTTSKEVLEGSIQVSKPFLRSAFGGLVHPGDTALVLDRLLELDQLSVERVRVGPAVPLLGFTKRLPPFVGLPMLLQTPVVGPSSIAGMLAQRLLLCGRGLDFNLACKPHWGSTASKAGKLTISCHGWYNYYELLTTPLFGVFASEGTKRALV